MKVMFFQYNAINVFVKYAILWNLDPTLIEIL